MTTIKISAVDAALDTVGDDADPSATLADLIDSYGAWDWSDDGEHDPSERVATVESSGAWWAVYRGSETDESRRCASEEEAREIADGWIEQVS